MKGSRHVNLYQLKPGDSSTQGPQYASMETILQPKTEEGVVSIGNQQRAWQRR